MKLEDHAGDIIRKARTMSGVSLEAAADLVGVSAEALRRLEQSGANAALLDLTRLAPQIGLSAEKLAILAEGWLPTPVTLDRWKRLSVITTSDEDMSVNCFLVWDTGTREAALFDTGFDLAPVLHEIANNDLKLAHLFITHGHPDHVEGLSELSGRFPEACLHRDLFGALSAPAAAGGKEVRVGRLLVSARPTPGHAEDGVTYVITQWPDEAPPVAVVGDAIFAGSMGRAPGLFDAARQAVREQILSLEDSTLICPGHGPLTTVAEELVHNPFF